MESTDTIIGPDELILITGAAGFIGRRVVVGLLERGFRNLRCIVRKAVQSEGLDALIRQFRDKARIEIVTADLLSEADCDRVTRDVQVIYHLAAGRSDRIDDAFRNSVTATRNLIEATVPKGCLKRFVNISSFSVYSNQGNPQRRVLNEDCPLENRPEDRGDAYTYGKVKQDEIVFECAERFGTPYVIVRPGVVYGPDNDYLTNRVGIGAFGIFLHFGGSNTIPLTYVDNCADAIIMAGLKRGIEREVFNVVDDDLPSSRRLLGLYKKKVAPVRSIYVPKAASYALCYMWEKCANWSAGRLPLKLNRKGWHVFWKKTTYSNAKLKQVLGWSQRVPSADALERFFEGCRGKRQRA